MIILKLKIQIQKYYSKYEKKALEKIDGMYSIAFWNKEEKKIILARDPLGIKPLFYSVNKNEIIFSSEAKPLAKALNINLSEELINEFMLYGYIPGEKTFFNSIYALPPGHILEFKKDFYTLQKINNKYLNKSNKKLKEVLQRSINIQAINEVKTGIFLSGGQDSTCIASLVSKFHDNISAYTASFIPTDPKFLYLNEDSKKAKQTAKFHNLKIKEVEVKSFDVPDLMVDLFSKIDQPIIDPALIVSYRLALEAKKDHTKVILSGLGGDELFYGYSRYHSKYRKLFSILTIARLIAKYILKINFLPINILEKIARIASLELDMSISTTGANNFLKAEKSSYLKLLRKDHFINFWGHKKDPKIAQPRNFDIFNYLPNNLLYGLDQTLMLNTIEGRVPILGQGVINKSIDKKNNLKNPKGVIREIIKDKNPEYFRPKKKYGFSGPVEDWVRSNEDFFLSWTSKLFNKYEMPRENIKFDLENYQDCLSLFGLTGLSIWIKYNWDE